MDTAFIFFLFAILIIALMIVFTGYQEYQYNKMHKERMQILGRDIPLILKKGRK